MKIVLSSLTLAGVIAALIGVTARPSAALPVMQPQTSQVVGYWHHHHWYRHHHHYYHGGGINIHL
jgi:hypothetical protein